MNSKLLALAPLFAFLLLGGNVAYASTVSTGFQLGLVGGVVAPGAQDYTVSGGHLVSALIDGSPVNVQRSDLDYQMSASVTSAGSISGRANFDLNGQFLNGTRFELDGKLSIDSAALAVPFTVGVIPLIFHGTASLSIELNQYWQQANGQATSQAQNNGNWKHGGEQTLSLPMSIESPYLNPFGGPIAMATDDGEVILVATYYSALIHWEGVQMGGSIEGSLQGNPVTGVFGQVVNSIENLKSGVEYDHGTIAFLQMSNSTMNAAGTFSGVSQIPTTGESDCSTALGLPPGTCTQTGLNSQGDFRMNNGNGGVLKGDYTTKWTAPAFGFGSLVVGTLRVHS